jgi:acyl-CoA synthetase (AMP-forming)/AMP-acid ligase II
MSNNQIFRNFGDVTRHLAATQPDRVALTFEGRDTTYGEFERYTNRVERDRSVVRLSVTPSTK